MTNSQSKPLKKGSDAAERIQTHVRAFPPPIGFNKSKLAQQKPAKDEIVKFKVRLDAEDSRSDQTERALQAFEDGDAETWCEFRRQFDDLKRLVPLDTPAKQEKAYEALLRGKALENFTTHRNTIQAKNSSLRTGRKLSDEECLRRAVDLVAQEYFPAKHSVQRQKFYMKYHL